MYTVGPWFVYLMNLAILAIVAIVVFVWMNVKRGQYLKEAAKCIQVEIIPETGQSKYYTVPLGANDEWVKIGNKRYKIDKARRRWGLHPRLPFIGLRSIQVQIRKETFYEDDPNPAYRLKKDLKGKTEEQNILTEEDRRQAETVLTAAEVDAMVREMTAIQAGVAVTEMQHRQTELTKAIGNQPNKMAVYVLAGTAAFCGVVLLIQRIVLGG